MTPQSQLIKHKPSAGRYGDCQRTCVAVILDLHPSEVPHFCDIPDAKRGTPQWWEERQRAWLAQHGLSYATVAYSGDVSLDQVMAWTSRQSPTVPMILMGTSSLGSNHVVVVVNGEIVCDPSGNGIVGPSQEGTWEVSVITVGLAWNARGIKRRDGVDQLDSMSEDERRRWDDGRRDWRDDKWQDHCGKPDCEQCEGNLIP